MSRERTDEERPRDDPVLASVAAYSERASEYAAAHAAKMADRVARFAAALPAHATVLDAGCGPGRDLERFAALGLVARGVDLNPDFAAMARAVAPVILGDLRELEVYFAPASFDAIWASASLVHLSEADAATVLGHFARLLRPRGRLYVCVHMTGTEGWREEADGRRWYRVWGAGEFASLVTAAGFQVDAVDEGVMVELFAHRRDPPAGASAPFGASS